VANRLQVFFEGRRFREFLKNRREKSDLFFFNENEKNVVMTVN
jgi:hypothetical protein